MPLVVTNLGEVQALNAQTGKRTASVELELRLFKNDYTPVDSSGLADFTECDIAGYTARTLTNGTWNTAVSGDPSYSDRAEEVYNFTAIGNIYGYYVVDKAAYSASGVDEVLWAERFAGAPSVQSDGSELTLKLKMDAS